MENLERELEFTKAENVLLRLFKAFEQAVRANNESMADELANSLLNRIPEHMANLYKRVDYLRNDVLAAPSKEDRVKLLETIKSVEPELELWSKKLKKIEKYLDRSAYFSSPKEESKIEKPIGFKLVKKNPAATAAEIQLLVKIANALDKLGLYDEAGILDSIITKEASKNDLIKALKSREDNAAQEAINALTSLVRNVPANSTPAQELGITDSEFKELIQALSPNNANLDFERAQDIMGVSSDPTPVINPMLYNPFTKQPYAAPMPKGFCPDCGKKLVMRYPGGDPENGPADLRCPQGHQGAEPCEICPHFFHTNKCKACDCYSSFGTEKQMKEEEEMLKKMYGDDWDKDPNIDPNYGGP